MILDRLIRVFDLTYDLVGALDDEKLCLKINNAPSNTIGEQLWCVIGARESYLALAQKGEWQGFSSSLNVTSSIERVLECITSSQRAVLGFVSGKNLEEHQLMCMMDILEHEILHHGQLIRYFYANKLSFPKSWNERYTV